MDRRTQYALVLAGVAGRGAAGSRRRGVNAVMPGGRSQRRFEEKEGARQVREFFRALERKGVSLLFKIGRFRLLSRETGLPLTKEEVDRMLPHLRELLDHNGP